jgi:preprotein translocase subunit SecG
MEQMILVVHLVASLAIIGLIMLQQGKGADMGASFGAGASQTLFGSDGSGNVLTKATTWLVVLFFSTSFALAVVASQKSGAVSDLEFPVPAAVEEEIPAVVVDEDLPMLDEEVPAALSNPDDDLPSLD